MNNLLNRFKLNNDEDCDAECREYKTRMALKSEMEQNKLLISRYEKQYENSQNDYYNRIHGTNWEKNKNITIEKSKLKTQYDVNLKQFDSEFQSLAKYYIDSLFLLKNQKTVISKNKKFSKNHKKQIEKQKELMGELDFLISTTNRKINFSQNERTNTGATLRAIKYIFYILLIIVITGVAFILFIKLKQKYNLRKKTIEMTTDVQKRLKVIRKPKAIDTNVQNRVKFARKPVIL